MRRAMAAIARNRRRGAARARGRVPGVCGEVEMLWQSDHALYILLFQWRRRRRRERRRRARPASRARHAARCAVARTCSRCLGRALPPHERSPRPRVGHRPWAVALSLGTWMRAPSRFNTHGAPARDGPSPAHRRRSRIQRARNCRLRWRLEGHPRWSATGWPPRILSLRDPF